MKLLLVDDHLVVRSGISSCLTRQERFAILGEAADGLEAVRKAKGTANAQRLSTKQAPPRSAMAVMGEKLGGCGINREAAAARIMPPMTSNRFFSISVLLVCLISAERSKWYNLGEDLRAALA